MAIPTFVWAIAAMVGGYLLMAASMPRTEKPKASLLEDFDMPQVEEGTPQCVVFGDAWVSDYQVLYYGNLRTSEIKSKGGKK